MLRSRSPDAEDPAASQHLEPISPLQYPIVKDCLWPAVLRLAWWPMN